MATTPDRHAPRAMPISRAWIWAGATVLVLAVATMIALTRTDNVALLLIGTLLFTAFAFTHGVLRYGVRTMVIFLVAVVVIGWSYESLSIATGFPFGDYYYTDGMGAKIGQVPFAIMPSYFAFGYLSWSLATVLLGKRDNGVSGSDTWALPIVSSFVMVMWDVCMDPLCSTLLGEWVWEDGGPYFGVPLSNFMGWFLTVFTFYVVFALYLRFGTSHREVTSITTRPFWVLAILMYATIAIEFWGEWLRGASTETVTDQAGQVWQTADILASMVLVSTFTMLFVSILGLTLLWREKSPDPGPTESALA